MKKFACFLAIFIVVIGQFIILDALTFDPSPPPPTSPDLLITSLISLDGVLPDYLEVYNQSSSPVKLADLGFILSERDSGPCDGTIIRPLFANQSGWILSKKYLSFQRVAEATDAGEFSLDESVLSGCSGPWLNSIKLTESDHTLQSLDIPDNSTLAPITDSTVTPAVTTYFVARHHQRNNSINSSRVLSDDFSSDYNIASVDASTELYSDPLYTPPATAQGLQIIELLPHSINCSPIDPSLVCNDYIKIWNAGNRPVNLSDYRLRTSYGGSKSTTSNTINLSGVIDPGKYFLINTRNDGSALSLTESGGYVWLEDAYGTAIYQPVANYPDASSANKTGWSWAYDGKQWRWSNSPQPTGSNIFPAASNISTLMLITGSSLKPCSAGQYRNPATNRCRTLVTTASSSSGTKPCPAGQERNPATNRCRKTSAVLGASTVNVADIATPTIASNTQWALAGGSIALALGYAAFEWRQEILLGLRDSRARLLSALKNLRN